MTALALSAETMPTSPPERECAKFEGTFMNHITIAIGATTVLGAAAIAVLLFATSHMAL